MIAGVGGFIRVSFRSTGDFTSVFQKISSRLISKMCDSVDDNETNEIRSKVKHFDVTSSQFNKLGLIPELVNGLLAQDIKIPTPVQQTVIPRLVNGENLVMAASTGSGKTLAYMLPAIQGLLLQEQNGYERSVKRPRCLVLVPTRELARQVLSVVKSLSHYAKVSSCVVLGGEPYTIQKKSLDRLVDIVVASPGRLMQHKEKGGVYLSHVTHIIIDEVDTMLTQGFGSDIRAILRSTLTKRPAGKEEGNEEDIQEERKVQLIMASATLTKAVKTLLDDVKGFNIEFNDPDNKTPRKFNGTEGRVHINMVEVDGVHRGLTNIQHQVEETKGQDKLDVLLSVLKRHAAKAPQTLIFCNTVTSCRAVEYALTEAGIDSLSYHGDLNSKEREENLQKFRDGAEQYLVCSDMAARGLDISEVVHVIMFDFPMNPVDYLHRAGRTGRAGRKGLVTSIITKKDKVLSDAIQGAIARGLPLDSLSSSRKDYQDRGKLATVLGRMSREEGARRDRVKEKDEKALRISDRGGPTSGVGGTGRSSFTRDGARVGRGGGSRSRAGAGVSSTRSSSGRGDSEAAGGSVISKFGRRPGGGAARSGRSSNIGASRSSSSPRPEYGQSAEGFRTSRPASPSSSSFSSRSGSRSGRGRIKSESSSEAPHTAGRRAAGTGRGGGVGSGDRSGGGGQGRRSGGGGSVFKRSKTSRGMR